MLANWIGAAVRVTRMGKLMCWWVLATSWGALLPLRAAGEVRPLTEALQVRRGAACLNRDTLAAQVAAWLGKQTIDRDLSVLVVASASDARDVSFELRRGAERLTNRRFFPAPAACAPLEAILGLAIAMALEVSLRDELLVSLAAAPRSAKSSLAVFAELGLGLLPGTSAGGALRAGFRAHRLVALHFDALLHSSQSTRLSGAPLRVDLDARLVGVRAAACLLVPLTRMLQARSCAGIGAGSLQITGRGYRGARAARLPWSDVVVGAELSHALSRHWSIEAGANLEWPLGERSYGIRNSDGSVAASDSLPRGAATLRAGPAYYF